jgi:HD-like signal output (HDOD) protein/ActR/RegA family two-component response regulator
MSRILVVDASAIVRDPLASSLRLAGYETATAATGKECVHRAKTFHPNLILLDTATPDMGGLHIAERLHADPKYKNIPIILLGNEVDRKTILHASRLGIREFLLKSRFSMDDLLLRVRRNIGQQPSNPPAPGSGAPADDVPCLLTKAQCLARLESAMAARPLSGVLAQVILMVSSPTAQLSDLATLIARDPLLSARVLRAANSVGFNGTKKIVMTVAEAVRNIGVAAIGNLAVSLGVVDSVPAGGDDVLRVRGWQHSFATAMICQHLAERCPEEARPSPASAYMVGLCHDLGRILFRSEFADEYQQVLQAQAKTHRPLDQLERVMLGATELEVARLILKGLSLPDQIRAPIEEFQEAKANPAREPKSPLAKLLRIAKAYANGILMATSGAAQVSLITRADCKSACDNESPAIPDAANLRGQILAMTPLLARLSAPAEAELQRLVVGPTRNRVCLVRDAALSEFDPVEAALRSMSDVDVTSDFPPDEADYSAVVVTGRRRIPIPPHLKPPVLRLAFEADADAKATQECGPAISLEGLAAFVSHEPEKMRQVA